MTKKEKVLAKGWAWINTKGVEHDKDCIFCHRTKDMWTTEVIELDNDSVVVEELDLMTLEEVMRLAKQCNGKLEVDGGKQVFRVFVGK